MISAHFSRSEFACKCGCGFDTVDVELAKVLEYVRDYYGVPIVINSGCRCPAHNDSVGGSSSSQHLLGKAADFRVVGVGEEKVTKLLKEKYPNQYGIGLYEGRTHIDVRSNEKARWEA